MGLSRRTFLNLAPLAVLGPSTQIPATPAVAGAFPSHDPDLVREMVGVAHGNAARVRELLAGRPALANASWDWGYGDWESALGAASHVGNREIAGLLIDAGARVSIFSAAMLGQLDVVKAFVQASPGVQKTRGPHGITLLAHAKAGGPGAADVVKYLDSLGDADPRYTNAPLDDATRTAIAGTYAVGTAPGQRLTVAVTDRGGVSIQRDGATARGLFHLGDRVFHPTGAPAVRVRFAAGERSDTMTVEDGPLVVRADRV
jgi:hypothetical protein